MKTLRLFISGFGLLVSTHIHAQTCQVSGKLLDATTKEVVPFTEVTLTANSDGKILKGFSDPNGRFAMSVAMSETYSMDIRAFGYSTLVKTIYVGKLSSQLDLGNIELYEDVATLSEVEIVAEASGALAPGGVQRFEMAQLPTASGGSASDVLTMLPGIQVEEGKILLRGSDQVTVLLDGKLSAITGFGGTSGLANLPASAIERIEIQTNPNAKNEANGSAGVVNVVLKKQSQEGFNGTVGLSGGLGALFVKKANMASIDPPFAWTPKVNPSIALNYRKNKWNVFGQTDYLYTQTLNANQFVERLYEDGTTIHQETRRNRTTQFTNSKVGIDYTPTDQWKFQTSAYYGTELIYDLGQEHFVLKGAPSPYRKWDFIEDELKTTGTISQSIHHGFERPGQSLDLSGSYSFHRENEQYHFSNTVNGATGLNAFKLLSDERITQFNVDYVQPYQFGKWESGAMYRGRSIPTNMQFFPGINSPLDSAAGGEAIYGEKIPALYSNVTFENQYLELEGGLRWESARIDYWVNPNHPTYSSDGYSYGRLFPSARLAYKWPNGVHLQLSHQQRVDRPNEVDIRIFPKYDDAEIIKVGNPGLQPQFSKNTSLQARKSWGHISGYVEGFSRQTENTIARVAVTVPGSPLIYHIFENAGTSKSQGIDMWAEYAPNSRSKWSFSATYFTSSVTASSLNILYPISQLVQTDAYAWSGLNAKAQYMGQISDAWNLQASWQRYGRAAIPQGYTSPRSSLDLALSWTPKNAPWKLVLNATDVFGTNNYRYHAVANGVILDFVDFKETQTVRLSWRYTL